MFGEAKVSFVFCLKSCSLGVTDGLGHSLCHIQGPAGNREEMSPPPASPFQSFIGLPQEEAQDGIVRIDPKETLLALPLGVYWTPFLLRHTWTQ